MMMVGTGVLYVFRYVSGPGFQGFRGCYHTTRTLTLKHNLLLVFWLPAAAAGSSSVVSQKCQQSAAVVYRSEE